MNGTNEQEWKKEGLKGFIDQQVQKKTKYATAEQLLKGHRTRLVITAFFVIPAVLQLFICLAFEVTGIEMVMVILERALIIGGLGSLIWFSIKKKKMDVNGTFAENIDIEDLRAFLNGHLGYLSPYLNEWNQISSTELKYRNAADAESERNLYSVISAKGKYKCIVTIRPSVKEPDSGKWEYFIGIAEHGKRKNFLAGGLGFTVFGWYFKIVPIMQAAMDYYLQYYCKTENQHAETMLVSESERTMQKPVEYTQESAEEKQETKKAGKKGKIVVLAVAAVAVIVIAVFGGIWIGRSMGESSSANAEYIDYEYEDDEYEDDEYTDYGYTDYGYTDYGYTDYGYADSEYLDDYGTGADEGNEIWGIEEPYETVIDFYGYPLENILNATATQVAETFGNGYSINQDGSISYEEIGFYFTDNYVVDGVWSYYPQYFHVNGQGFTVNEDDIIHTENVIRMLGTDYEEQWVEARFMICYSYPAYQICFEINKWDEVVMVMVFSNY